MAMVGLCRCYISQWDWFWDAIASLIGYDYKVAREIGSKLAPTPPPTLLTPMVGTRWFEDEDEILIPFSLVFTLDNLFLPLWE